MQAQENGKNDIYDVLILGGGPGGYTAALYAARAGLRALVIERLSAGGQMASTGMVENYPGFDEGIDGFDLGEKMQRQAERFGAKTVLAEVGAAHLTETPKRLTTDVGDFLGRTVVLAPGAGPRALGVPGEDALRGRGVSYCATCDGMLYRGRDVVVVGGGNTAVTDALTLARICRHVTLVHRRDTLRASAVYMDRLREAGVEILWNTEVTGLLSGERLTGVTLRSNKTGETRPLGCDGLFIAAGRKPDTALVQGQVATDPAGYLIAGEDTKTSLPGVYAVGDARQKAVRQIVTATADGACAVHAIEEYLQAGGGPRQG